jgi:hypothetical protein
LLLAAALLTKTTAYVVAGVAVVAVLIRWQRERQPWKWAVGQLGWVLVPALLVSAPWFIRNGLTYGWYDPLGLERHNGIVEGQLRSSEYLALHGWGGLLSQMARTTFQSFWGQFGWMGVVLPARIYQGLALLSALIIAGFLWWLFERRHLRLAPAHTARVPRVQPDLCPASGPLPVPSPHSHRDGGRAGAERAFESPATANTRLGDGGPFRRAGNARRVLPVQVHHSIPGEVTDGQICTRIER